MRWHDHVHVRSDVRWRSNLRRFRFLRFSKHMSWFNNMPGRANLRRLEHLRWHGNVRKRPDLFEQSDLAGICNVPGHDNLFERLHLSGHVNLPRVPNLRRHDYVHGNTDLRQPANLSRIWNVSGDGDLRWSFNLCGHSDLRVRRDVLWCDDVRAEPSMRMQLWRPLQPECGCSDQSSRCRDYRQVRVQEHRHTDHTSRLSGPERRLELRWDSQSGGCCELRELRLQGPDRPSAVQPVQLQSVSDQLSALAISRLTADSETTEKAAGSPCRLFFSWVRMHQLLDRGR